MSQQQELQEILNRINVNYHKSIDCESGWYQLIIDCHKELLALDPNYEVFQIKQKFGGLRYYFGTNDNAKRIDMHRVTRKYETLAYTTCEETGKEGAVLMKSKHGYMKTLHPDHAPEGFTPYE
jgi:hypothetical protein